MMGFRTLIRIWTGSASKRIEALTSFLNVWLSDLGSKGVNILFYGEEEKRLHEYGHIQRDFYRAILEAGIDGKEKTTKLINEAYGTLRLISFSPAATPEKWQLWWSEPTDEFDGDFWEMIKRTRITIPGAWDETLEL